MEINTARRVAYLWISCITLWSVFTFVGAFLGPGVFEDDTQGFSFLSLFKTRPSGFGYLFESLLPWPVAWHLVQLDALFLLVVRLTGGISNVFFLSFSWHFLASRTTTFDLRSVVFGLITLVLGMLKSASPVGPTGKQTQIKINYPQSIKFPCASASSLTYRFLSPRTVTYRLYFHMCSWHWPTALLLSLLPDSGLHWLSPW